MIKKNRQLSIALTWWFFFDWLIDWFFFFSVAITFNCCLLKQITFCKIKLFMYRCCVVWMCDWLRRPGFYIKCKRNWKKRKFRCTYYTHICILSFTHTHTHIYKQCMWFNGLPFFIFISSSRWWWLWIDWFVFEFLAAADDWIWSTFSNFR